MRPPLIIQGDRPVSGVTKVGPHVCAFPVIPALESGVDHDLGNFWSGPAAHFYCHLTVRTLARAPEGAHKTMEIGRCTANAFV